MSPHSFLYGFKTNSAWLATTSTLLLAPRAFAQPVPEPAKPSLTPYAQLIVNVGLNTGTAQPSQDAPTGAPAGSLVGDGLASDGSFLITARQSRIGLEGSYPLSDDLDAAGKVELDFWGLHEDGGPTAITQPSLRLRLGYAQLGDDTWHLVAGQTWSVVTPRLPLSIGHSAIVLHTGAGVLWQRLPQLGIALTPALDDSEEPSRVKFDFALVRSVSGEPSAGAITRADNPDPGTASRLPGVETHLGFESKLIAVGLGAHWSRERFQTIDAGGLSGDVARSSWLASADAKLSTQWFWLGAQAWRGSNLNGFFSRQGVRLTRGATDPADPAFSEIRDVHPLPATGGWVEVGVPASKQLKLVASVGAELGDSDEVADGATERNLGFFVGAFYSPIQRLTTSVEYYHTDTRYKAPEGAPESQTRGKNDNLTLNLKLELE